MFYVLLSHGNAVLPNWTLKGSLCSNCTTPLWVGFITPRCYICQFDQNIVWYIMQLSFCYKLRSRGWRTLQCWYWRWGNSCRASQLVVNRTSTTTSPVLFGTFFNISEFFLACQHKFYVSPQCRKGERTSALTFSIFLKQRRRLDFSHLNVNQTFSILSGLAPLSISGQIRQKRDSLKVL